MNIDQLSDTEIVDALLRRDSAVTRLFLYKKCRPLFRSIYQRYYTDCADEVELVNEIYLFVMTPSKSTGRNRLQGFTFRCSFTLWLKIVAEHYCHSLYAHKLDTDENFSVDSDRNADEALSLVSESNSLTMADATRILESMPNERYRALIRLRYLEELSNEETAARLGLSMANYYNVHLRAKNQWCDMLKQEGLL